MTDHNPRPGNKVAQFCSDSIDVHHAIVQIKHLALPGKLAVDRIANQPLVVLRDDRLDRQTILRRRFDGAHVARAGEGEIKRPWDGRGAEREHVHHFAQQLEFFFVHHAEALFDHHQANVLECNVVLDEPMRADDNIHGTGGKILDHAFLLAWRAEAREQFDAHGVVGHALAKGVEVLLRENRGRHQDGDLLAAHHRFEGSANRDFCFAKANVAADEPVHGFGPFHIKLRCLDRLHLVGRFLKNK